MTPDAESRPLTWDPLVRIFHWSLVTFFCLAYYLEGDWLGMHSHAGYTITLLVLFRLVWGVIGVGHARFSDFVVHPGESLTFLAQLLRGNAGAHDGHDPAAALMILLLLASLLITTFTGMSLFAMEGSGPLAGVADASWPGALLANVHAVAADLTACLIILHVAGVLLTSLRLRENLIGAMVTGRKRRKP